MKFSDAFELRLDQSELDFVDIDTRIDLPLFFDPYAFATSEDAWSRQCHDEITTFFEAVLDAVRNGRDEFGLRLVSELREPNETCLGFSHGRPAGRGIGRLQAAQIYERLRISEAARTGVLADLSDCALFIEGISYDKISDVTTNLIRRHLITYTQDQCTLHGVTNLRNVPSGSLWDAERRRWTYEYVALPVISGRPILLVPKAFVRWRGEVSHLPRRYYQHFVLNFLRDFHLSADSALVHTLKDGRRVVYKTKLAEQYPCDKEFLYRFSRENPEVLQNYKAAVRRQRLVTNEDLEEEFDEGTYARVLKEQLARIPTGRGAADRFHKFMVGTLEFIFWPNLVCPKVEQPIHGQRKRIDITYTNNANSGTFYRIHTHHHVTALYVMVECKNYSSDPANPELDQLSSRFSANRGRFGLLVARQFKDRELFLERCRDTARDQRGIVLPLVDEDFFAMLTLIENRGRHRIDRYLDDILRAVFI